MTIEKLLGIGNIADAENWELKHYVETAIKAHALYKRDVEYVVKDGEVIIVDTFTGRLMPGRRWSDGLHQSIEAKEGVNIRKEDQTLATITFQNYFRLYQEAERHDRHGGDRSGRVREDLQAGDRRHSHQQADAAAGKSGRGLPHGEGEVQGGGRRHCAAAREASSRCWWAPRRLKSRERLSGILQRKGVRHVVLNAKFHEREAEIVAQAGRLGMVTISTNMAGRGTDILLGGNPEFMARQELVKKNKARAISVAEGAINPMAPAGISALLLPGPGVRDRRAGVGRGLQGPRRGGARRITSR